MHKIHTFLLTVSALFLYGCSSTRTFTQEELRSDRDHDITVQTKDGRTIFFHKEEYRIIDDDYGSVQGKGRLVISETRNDYRDWEGVIAFTEIKKITSSTSTALGTAGGIIIVSTATLIAILILFPPKLFDH